MTSWEGGGVPENFACLLQNAAHELSDNPILVRIRKTCQPFLSGPLNRHFKLSIASSLDYLLPRLP
jgi:hypothetical protein